MNKPGEYSAELHANYTAEGHKSSGFSTEIPPNQTLRTTLEPALGLTRYWELGAYLQSAYDKNSQAHFAGTKLRTKILLPKRAPSPLFLGINTEIGWVPDKFEESRWSAELRPIIGWKPGRWLFDVNPILNWSLSGGAQSASPAFEPAGKIRFDTRRGYGLGVEYYGGLGEINHMPRAQEQEHTLYAIFDLLEHPTEMNIGLGRGLTAATNDWTIKTIIGRAF